MSVIGIDFGTTSLKVCVLDQTKKIIYENQKRHEAESELGIQDAQLTMKIGLAMIDEAQKACGENISKIAIAGQMHGIVFWESDALEKGDLNCSKLYTWQFPKCSERILEKLTSYGPITVFPGYGCATLSYLQENRLLDAKWNSCGTIMDLFATLLTRSSFVLIGAQNANSWGCARDGEWTIPKNRFSVKMPQIVLDGTFLTKTVPKGSFSNAKVLVPFGDLQTAIYPFIKDHTAVLNIGTAAQICCLVPNDYRPSKEFEYLRVDPFNKDRKLLLAAGLNGGTSLNTFLSMVADWAKGFNAGNTVDIDISSIIEKANQMATVKTSVHFRPTFHGERGVPEMMAAEITGLNGMETFDQILASLHRGIIETLFTLMPVSLLESLGVKALCLTGSASEPRFLTHIEAFIKEKFTRINGSKNVSAAYGAACQALDSI